MEVPGIEPATSWLIDHLTTLQYENLFYVHELCYMELFHVQGLQMSRFVEDRTNSKRQNYHSGLIVPIDLEAS